MDLMGLICICRQRESMKLKYVEAMGPASTFSVMVSFVCFEKRHDARKCFRAFGCDDRLSGVCLGHCGIEMYCARQARQGVRPR